MVDDLWLQPRDPLAWAAHWSANPASRRIVEERLGRGRWWLRLREASPEGTVISEHPATEHEGSAILRLESPGRACVAELGYDSFHAGWHPVARVVAPAPACDPHDVPSSANLGNPSVAEPSGTGAHLAPVPVHPNPPAVTPADVAGSAPPSPEALRAWEAWFAGVGVDSAEWLQRIETSHGSPTGQRIHPSRAMAHDTAPSPPSPSSSALVHSHPAHAHGRPFRFAVNVEVIVHGNTEPDALVTAGGRPLPLRADGSFSVRWLLPNGEHRVPLVAVSRDGKARRDARLRLGRATDHGGEVGVHALAAGPADPIAGWAG